MDSVDVCVAGGGPAGMVAGLLFARAGLRVTVLEKHADFLRDFRGDTVHPSTLRLLDELGLGERFAALPRGVLQEMRMQIGDHVITAADFRRLPGRHRYIAMVPQGDFLDLLADEAGTEPTFTLRRCTEVLGLTRDGERVTGVRCRSADGTEGTITATLVLGCDGRSSVVREAAGLPVRELPAPMDVWQVRIPAGPADEVKDGRVFGRFTRGLAAVTMDRGDYYQTSYLIPKGRDAELRARGLDAFRRDLSDLFGWPPDRLAAVSSWDDVKLLNVRVTRLRRWYRPGLLCIGDAAHAMSPVGGVGVNLAVQDAVAAARILAGPLRRGTLRTAHLARVQRRRRLPVVASQAQQHGEHETLLRPALEATLDGVPPLLRAVDRVPALRGLTAYLGGVGLRPEHAPRFARR
ncbi:FAD-dependent oxidoreductase [Amycolatopsis thermophila]|uniref:2-polyprenyl-6-methoxyphenol hydroxylase-like FAD-dependent oxidoreductase n=1 Tax=Amycolatopsis thermophila TaxID=206084 RepID=A0ABU0F0G7_9PSEU|nr:FAD-dependent oxidoreductase [Amycolatopsis thermophila]MDQ0381061.1 2-polyprenyl-6-methoxyphenol hydroxylase-like FAD-dependent oxidoreductase [Amycolatopsis thermophila]